jgi:hypothetical protein
MVTTTLQIMRIAERDPVLLGRDGYHSNRIGRIIRGIYFLPARGRSGIRIPAERRCKTGIVSSR